jgi:hypothetical protein
MIITIDKTALKELLQKETSYREGESFHPVGDLLWFNLEYANILGEIEQLAGSIFESREPEGIRLKDYKSTDDGQRQFLADSIKQLMVAELARRWYKDRGVDSGTTESYYILVRNNLYPFRIKAQNFVQYPHKDQEYWGDDYNMKNKIKAYVENDPNA